MEARFHSRIDGLILRAQLYMCIYTYIYIPIRVQLHAHSVLDKAHAKVWHAISRNFLELLLQLRAVPDVPDGCKAFMGKIRMHVCLKPNGDQT